MANITVEVHKVLESGSSKRFVSTWSVTQDIHQQCMDIVDDFDQNRLRFFDMVKMINELINQHNVEKKPTKSTGNRSSYRREAPSGEIKM